MEIAMKMNYLLLAVPLVAMATFVAAQTTQKDNSQKTKATGGVWDITVGPKDNPMFVPDSLPNVKVGDQISFHFVSGPHTATSDSSVDPKSGFNTGTGVKGQIFTFFANKPGKITYHCEYDFEMKGTITVN
jgi:plastocyanin